MEECAPEPAGWSIGWQGQKLKRVLGPGCGTWTFLCREIRMQYDSDNKIRLIGRERPCSGVLPVQGELGAGRTPGSHQSLNVWAEDGCVYWRPRRASMLNPKCSLPQLPGQDKSHTSCGYSVYKGSLGQEHFNHPKDSGSKFITTTTTPAPILVPWFSVRCQELFITYRNRRQAAGNRCVCTQVGSTACI